MSEKKEQKVLEGAPQKFFLRWHYFVSRHIKGKGSNTVLDCVK
jgi:hypothetical protein